MFPDPDCRKPDSLVFLNKDPKYVMNNLICDFDKPTMDPGSPYVEALKEMNYKSVFVPHHLIYREVAAVLERD